MNDAINGSKFELASEYENMNATWFANMYNSMHTMIDEIKPNFTEYLAAILMFSYFFAPYATPATVIAAVPTPIAGNRPNAMILHPAV